MHYPVGQNDRTGGMYNRTVWCILFCEYFFSVILLCSFDTLKSSCAKFHFSTWRSKANDSLHYPLNNFYIYLCMFLLSTLVFLLLRLPHSKFNCAYSTITSTQHWTASIIHWCLCRFNAMQSNGKLYPRQLFRLWDLAHLKIVCI